MVISTLLEKDVTNYLLDALRELVLNAVMHRDYQLNMPTRFYQFDDRIEIMNHGGLYGKTRPENFPDVNDYRNPIIAQALKVLGYVNMFNRGVCRVRSMIMSPSYFQVEDQENVMTILEMLILPKKRLMLPKKRQTLPRKTPILPKIILILPKKLFYF